MPPLHLGTPFSMYKYCFFVTYREHISVIQAVYTCSSCETLVVASHALRSHALLPRKSEHGQVCVERDDKRAFFSSFSCIFCIICHFAVTVSIVSSCILECRWVLSDSPAILKKKKKVYFWYTDRSGSRCHFFVKVFPALNVT